MQTQGASGKKTARTGFRRLRVQPWWAMLGILLVLMSLTLASLQAPHPNPLKPLSQRNWSELLRYPIEVNATRRLPVAPNAIRDIEVLSEGLRGWVVGDAGTILSTNDGGRTWAAQVSGVQVDLYSIEFNADGQHGWVVGVAGTILSTNDGGRTWAAQLSGVQADLWSIQFNADGQRGWVVGDAGTILSTSDGGHTWTPQIRGMKAYLWSVQFNADGQRGWAVGVAGTILSTNDGGRTWAAQLSGTQANLSALQFSADGQYGWVVGDAGTILSTNDGGRTWGAQTSGGQANLSAVQFSPDGHYGWAVGAGGTILSTSDGGRTWSTETSGVQYDLRSVQFTPDGQHGWAVGVDGTILSTSDRGHTWLAQKSGVHAGLWAVYFNSDGQRGWVAGDDRTLISTSDGGRTWAPQVKGVRSSLRSVQFTSDGQNGWAVGSGGTILSTSNGGNDWSAQTSGVDVWLWWVHFNADGRRGWAVGAAGTILVTSDGGRTWGAQVSGVQANLYWGQFSADGQRGWVVGAGGTILFTSDGGTHWEPIVTAKVGSGRLAGWVVDTAAQNIWAVGYPPALIHTSDGGRTWAAEPWPLSYSRYPAPWFWLSLVAAALCWWQSLRSPVNATEQGAEAMVATDAPTTDFAQDRLHFGPLAKGISRFLRNASTEPPLTLAISGNWGSGKSSLMGLVCSDLRRHGSRPVWFNAWHHQKDEQLLAALLNAVRDQGLPSSFTPDGWIFRLRLLWLRSKKHFLLASAIVGTVSALIAFLMVHNTEEWGKLWSIVGEILPWLNTAATGSMNPLSAGELGKLLAQLASGITVLAALRKALTAFGADPAVLLSATVEQFRLKDASALTNFRARFSAQFGEVTQCLPYRMVIVIDDLDRCRPEAVLDVMEAVNFLVSSGTCFVMFGMATNRVEAALALSFDKIASEMVELATKPCETPTPVDKDRMERDRRRSYARDYMEKLVNLEIVVPAIDDVEPHLLLEPLANDTRTLRLVLRPLVSLWPLVLCVAAISVGSHLGARWQFSDPPPPPVLQMGARVLTPASSSNNGSDTSPALPATLIVPSLYPVPTVQPGDEREIAWYIFAIPIGLLVGWGLGFALFRLRTNLYSVKDSRAFLEALRIWIPLVQQHRKTPRALKRFGNRIRYLAMLQQAERLDESRLDALFRVIFKWLRKPTREAIVWTESTDAASLAQNASDLSEDMVVALGAINEVFGVGWRQYVEEFPSGLEDSVCKAVERHRMGQDTRWSPTAAELDSFERSLQGIRVPST